MEKKDIAYQIGAYLEKYYATNNVKLPQTGFKIKQISRVVIEENSILEFDNLISFKGNATIVISDGTTNILTTLNKREFTGNAKIKEIKNYPEVQSVTITKIFLNL